jgi:glycosyltransferase involved in cell wall biosynthesis
MAQRLRPVFVYVEDGWPDSATRFPIGEWDACIWFVRFRELRSRSPFDWTGFGGLRVLHDHDALLSFGSPDGLSPYLGAWPDAFRRHRFDLILTSGAQIAARFRDLGIEAEWVPKGFDPTRFFDLGRARAGVATYGTPYLARRMVLAELDRRGIAVTSFSCPFEMLNDYLNRFAATVICNLTTEWRLRRLRPLTPIGRRITRITNGLGFSLRPGLEPMIKNFEVPATGSAPIADWLPELADLGFVDGTSILAYRTVDELADTIAHYRDRPDDLRRIGRAAAELCHERHTWAHRVALLEQVVRSRLQGQHN